MIDFDKLMIIIVNGVSFIAVIAAFASTIIMYQMTKKFGSGILARGFKMIGTGVLFIAFGIGIDVFDLNFYLGSNVYYTDILIILKGISFVIGTYIIVIGSKKMIDKIEDLTR